MGNPDVCQALLDAGANVNITTECSQPHLVSQLWSSLTTNFQLIQKVKDAILAVSSCSCWMYVMKSSECSLEFYLGW